MLKEKVTPENFREVRDGELALFEKVRRLTAEPDSEHLAGKLISATTDLKAWQLHFFDYTDLKAPISSRIYEMTLGLLMAAQINEQRADDDETDND